MVSIVFEFDTQYSTFRDALVLPDDHGLSDAELEAMKQQRLDNWITVITTPVSEEMMQQILNFQKTFNTTPAGE